MSKSRSQLTSRAIIVLGVGLAATLALPTFAAAQAITEYPLPAGSSGPGGITEGPDGALWFTLGNTSQIGRITPAGVFSIYPTPTANSNPTQIANGPDGALWFTEATANQIGRITTSGVITEFPLPNPGSTPVGITSGPDGALWFTVQGPTTLIGNNCPAFAAQIGRITTSGCH
jgi:virginiamycin B lyase